MEVNDEMINPDIIKLMSDQEKEATLVSIVSLHNTIKDPNQNFDDSHHEVADAIFEIIVNGKEGEIVGYQFNKKRE